MVPSQICFHCAMMGTPVWSPFQRLQSYSLSCFWFLIPVGEVDKGSYGRLPDGRDWYLPTGGGAESCPFSGWDFVSRYDYRQLVPWRMLGRMFAHG